MFLSSYDFFFIAKILIGLENDSMDVTFVQYILCIIFQFLKNNLVTINEHHLNDFGGWEGCGIGTS